MRFALVTTIEKAGGPALPNSRDLSRAERRATGFNGLAFFFGPLYYLAKGLWRQAVVYVLLAMAFALLMNAIGLARLGHAAVYGFAAIYALRANISYYRRLVLGEPPWFRCLTKPDEIRQLNRGRAFLG